MHPPISTVDAIVVLAYLAVTVALGLWIGRGNKSVDDFLLGNRDLPWWALLGSIVATETSTATFLSVPGLSFVEGGDFRFLQLSFGYIIGRGLVVLILLPGYFRGEFMTAYQLLHQRFGRGTQRFASAMFLVARNLGDGLRLYLTAIAVREAVGLPLPACIAVTGVVTLIYTLFGGMRSVVWNDCLQLVIYILAAIATLWTLTGALPGGSEQLWNFALEHDKLRVVRWDWNLADTYTIWAGVIGGAFLSLGTHGTDQIIVQRFLSARNIRDAGKALFLSGFVVLAQFALFLTIGVALACFYEQFPSGTELKGDTAYAAFIVLHLPIGLVGLTLAGVLSAAMSTLSSSLNSSAAAVVGDFGSWFGTTAMSREQQLTLSRVFTVGFGMIQIGVAIAAESFSRSVVNDALAIAGFTAGILFGVFLLGLLPIRVGPGGAIAGMTCGLATLLLVKFGPVYAPSIFSTAIAWPWYPVIGSVTTVAVGALLSALFPGRTEMSHGAA